MEIKQCKACGAGFSKGNRSRAQFERQRYCSRACYAAGKTLAVVRSCGRCGKPFMPPRTRPDIRFCSMACRSNATAKTCKFCGGPYRIKSSAASKRLTCSRSCAARLRGVEKRSPHQGKSRPDWVREKVGAGVAAYFSGRPERHWNYRGGPGQARKGNWTRQRSLARTRDGNTCRVCRKEGSGLRPNLPVHHITPYRTFTDPIQANHLENLITLCQSCHMKVEHGTVVLLRRRDT